eukprot:scaffold208_cov63-Attheya_sp.AAC.9
MPLYSAQYTKYMMCTVDAHFDSPTFFSSLSTLENQPLLISILITSPTHSVDQYDHGIILVGIMTLIGLLLATTDWPGQGWRQ